MKWISALLSALLILASLFLYLAYSLGDWSLVVHLWPTLLGFTLGGSFLVILLYFGILNRFRRQFHSGLRFFTSVVLFFGVLLGLLYLLSLSDPSLQAQQTSFLLKGSVVSLLLVVLFSLADFSWFAYHRFSAEHLQKLRIQHRQNQLQFSLLCSQLTPHYLFNGLNTASNLIRFAPAKGEQYLRQLGENLKSLLHQPKDQLNSLSQEISMAESFFRLMEVRFEDKISLKAEVDEAYREKQLPFLSLQTAVENALKHNVAEKKNPVIIHIRANALGVEIQNNITRAPQHLKSGGLGLRNLAERYRLLGKKQPQIQHGEQEFSIFLPYIHVS